MKKEVYSEAEAEAFIKNSVPVAKSALVKKEDEAVKFANKLGYPCVLKIVSPVVLHKTEVKGVRIVHNEQELRAEFGGLLAISKKKRIKLSSILVQEFVEGVETIIGIKRDPTFGHAVLFGIGGVFVELMKDISFRICPVDSSEVDHMINELKFRKLLFGFRNQKPVNFAVLKKAIVAISQLALKNPRISELDINPFVINDKFGKSVDARIVLE